MWRDKDLLSLIKFEESKFQAKYVISPFLSDKNIFMVFLWIWADATIIRPD